MKIYTSTKQNELPTFKDVPVGDLFGVRDRRDEKKVELYFKTKDVNTYNGHHIAYSVRDGSKRFFSIHVPVVLVEDINVRFRQ